MDGAHFDALARSFNSTRSRRAALGGLLAGTLGLLRTPGAEDAAAHDALLKCKKLKGDRKRKCVKKAKKHSAQHANELPPPEPTCVDGVQNGSETGVDCGGACPRCATGQDCATASDCASALCLGGTCQTCTGSPDNCGSDADGECFCGSPDAGGGLICVKNTGTGGPCESAACPAGYICINFFGPRHCFKPCGAA